MTRPGTRDRASERLTSGRASRMTAASTTSADIGKEKLDCSTRVPVITTGLSFGGLVAVGSAASVKEGIAARARTAAAGIGRGVLKGFLFLHAHFTDT